MGLFILKSIFSTHDRLKQRLTPNEEESGHKRPRLNEKRVSTTSEECSCEIANEFAKLCATEKEEEDKHVDFSTVSIRVYPLIIGDIPSCPLPLSLGWAFTDLTTENIDSYDYLEHVENPDYVTAKYIEPYTMEERRMRLRKVGYTNTEILREERRRKIQTVMEWAYRSCRDSCEHDFPCPVPQPEVYVRRYVV